MLPTPRMVAMPDIGLPKPMSGIATCSASLLQEQALSKASAVKSPLCDAGSTAGACEHGTARRRPSRAGKGGRRAGALRVHGLHFAFHGVRRDQRVNEELRKAVQRLAQRVHIAVEVVVCLLRGAWKENEMVGLG